jgi:hypothetical protein
VEKLSEHIAALELREPASERDEGIALIDEIWQWVQTAENAQVSPDADRQILKTFFF